MSTLGPLPRPALLSADQSVELVRLRVFLEVVTDPEVPPLPPHISFEQARTLTDALRKGDPGARAIIANSIKAKLAEYLTR